MLGSGRGPGREEGDAHRSVRPVSRAPVAQQAPARGSEIRGDQSSGTA